MRTARREGARDRDGADRAGSSGGHVGALAPPHVPENWNPKKAFQLESLLMAQGFWDAVREIGGGDAAMAVLAGSSH